MKARPPITTHVLDVNRGRPGAGVPVTLEYRSGPSQWEMIANGSTNSDGRMEEWLSPETVLRPGIYRLTFGTKEYFSGLGMKSFYPFAAVSFEVTDPKEHYHIPLLLSGHGYSTYRGS
jgi:5-hydroxyisourate hydrolase